MRLKGLREQWFSITLAVLFALVVAFWAGSGFLAQRFREWRVSAPLDEAEILMDRMDWGAAATRLREAMGIAPNSPAVIRAVLDFQRRTRATPGDVIQTLKKLSDSGDWNMADMLSLAEAEFARGAHEMARKTLATMPEAERSTNPAVMALEARMLNKEQRHSDAESRLRTALTAAPTDVESRFKLALLNFKQPHPDLQAQGRVELWNIVRAEGEAAPLAARVLASDALLTGAQAEELLRLAEAMSTESQETCLAVLTRLIRLRPQEKDAILDDETHRLDADDHAGRLRFAQWLAFIHEHERALALLPSEQSVKAGDLPAGLIEVRLEAFTSLRRLDEARLLLGKPEVSEKLGMVGFRLWQARLSAVQGDAPDAIRQHLNMAFDAASAEEDAAGSLQAARIAEQLGLPGMAALFYQKMAEKTSSPEGRLRMLERALAMHTDARDGTAMLKVARLLSELTPGNEANTFLADYLSLLLGESIEIIAARVEGPPGKALDAFTGRKRVFLSAIAAHRLQQPVRLAALKELQATVWPAGQRAVLAALIATSGDQEAAFRLGERIPASLLLPEEARMLTLAQ